jgi:hypothetical protein
MKKMDLIKVLQKKLYHRLINIVINLILDRSLLSVMIIAVMTIRKDN